MVRRELLARLVRKARRVFKESKEKRVCRDQKARRVKQARKVHRAFRGSKAFRVNKVRKVIAVSQPRSLECLRCRLTRTVICTWNAQMMCLV